MSIGKKVKAKKHKVKNKVLLQNHFYYYSSFRAAPLSFKTCLQLTV